MYRSRLALPAIAFALILSLFLLQPQTASLAQGDVESVPGQIVVKLNPANLVPIAAINQAYNTTTLSNLEPELNIYLLQTPNGVSAEQIVNQMAGDIRLLYAELNYIGDSPEGNPRSIGAWGGTDENPYTNQYVVNMLGLSQAHQLSRGVGTIVAVLDTGAQLNHPALASSWTSVRYNFVEGNTNPADVGDGQDNDADGMTDEMVGHGTHVAGIIHLVAPDAKIMPLRVLDSDGNGEFFAVAEAIDFAVKNGASVINLSLGTSAQSEMLEEAVERATEQGVVVVAAAGNLNSEQKQYPAAAECALPVTSVDANDRKSSFSNFGSWIGFAAPGEAIYSPFPTSGYATWSGTSMATPFVAGQAALIHTRAPLANPRQVAALIAATTSTVDSLNPQYEGKLGQGRINIGASLAYLQQRGFPESGSGTIGGSCVDEANHKTMTFLPRVSR